ncbi:MAG: hypothetical protein PHW13_00485 [Methylococcales bacterium]|nr:hypothetical protein [Methylococcales bacterium]
MKPIKTFCFALVLGLCSLPASGAYKFEPGDEVLTNCRQIYTRGFVKARVDDGYTIHFPKASGPINCPPFRWHNEFVVGFQSVPEYRLQFFGGLKRDILFRKGEIVNLRFETDKRLIKNKPTIDIEAEITDISSIGAISVKLLSKDPDAAATFWQWVGSNYIDLRHKALEAEIAKRSR